MEKDDGCLHGAGGKIGVTTDGVAFDTGRMTSVVPITEAACHRTEVRVVKETVSYTHLTLPTTPYV